MVADQYFIVYISSEPWTRQKCRNPFNCVPLSMRSEIYINLNNLYETPGMNEKVTLNSTVTGACMKIYCGFACTDFCCHVNTVNVNTS